jgi:hypothetical protein
MAELAAAANIAEASAEALLRWRPVPREAFLSLCQLRFDVVPSLEASIGF